ncbi:MAG: LysE family transporter [Phycisphaerae bacterium]|nr:LysE family transporter [Phycisphaerae bacterium]
MTELLLFLIQAVIISLSGVMAPGAMTAAAIAQGTRNRWAGILISIGHGAVEIPLIFLLMLGLHFLFEMPAVQKVVGLLGGAFLLWMGYGLLRQSGQPRTPQNPSGHSALSSIGAGIVLSAANPYFLLWWATVGLNLALGAKNLGIAALVLFAAVHWLCDLVWLSLLSFAAFYTNKRAGLWGRPAEKAILLFCGSALLLFGIKFIYSALMPA